MTLGELGNYLDDIGDVHGNLEVYCECDHGQWPENVSSVQLGYITEDGEFIHPDDIEDYDEGDYKPVVKIN